MSSAEPPHARIHRPSKRALIAAAVIGSLIAVLVLLRIADHTPAFQGVPESGEGSDVVLGWARADGSELPSLTALEAWGRPMPARQPRAFLINFWASFCGPCKDELPLLEEESRRPGGLPVVGVTRDVQRKWAIREMDAAGVSYPNLSDFFGEYMESLRSTLRPGLLPTTLLVVDNRIRWVHIGPFRTKEDLTKADKLAQAD